jgi:hypothetical protein
MEHGRAEFFNNNPGDVLSRRILQRALNRAAREQRLVEAQIDQKTRQGLFQPVELDSVKIGAAGEERDSGGSFILVFGVGFIMYLAILMYGQIILGAVIEEKETRIAEIREAVYVDDGQARRRFAGRVNAACDLGHGIQRVCVVRSKPSGVARNEDDEHSEYSSCPLYLFCAVLSARLLHLRDNLRARGFDGDDDAGRRPACDADHFDTGRELLPVSAGEPQS